MSITVYHVDAHTKKSGEMHKNNDIVDKLAAITIKIKRQYKIEDKEPLKKIIKTEYKVCQPKLEAVISDQEIRALHEQMGHVGAHAMKNWFEERNIKMPWHKIKNAIQKCQGCPTNRIKFNHRYRGTVGPRTGFNYIIQIDFIGPLKEF